MPVTTTEQRTSRARQLLTAARKACIAAVAGLITVAGTAALVTVRPAATSGNLVNHGSLLSIRQVLPTGKQFIDLDT